MIEVIEVIELVVVISMISVSLWAVDLIQRKTGHPLYDRVEDE